MNKKQRVSAFCVFMSAVCFSLGGICIKSIPWNPIAINGARSIIGVLIMLACLKITGHRFKFNRYVLLGGVCLFATTTFYVLANKLTTAANTIVLQFTAPVFIILYMWIFFKENPKKDECVTCGFVLLGIILFFLDSVAAGGTLGNVFAILSGAAYAVVFMFNTLPDADAFSSVVVGQSLNALIGLPLVAFETDFSLQTLMWVVVLGVFQLGLGYVFLANGLEHTPAVAASLISGIEPILNPVIVAIFLHEVLSPIAVCGAAIVLVSIICYNIKKDKENKVKKEV